MSIIAYEFLEQLRPGGPWVLTAIVPDGTTTTITAHNEQDVVDFVRQHNGKQNIYYAVNPTRVEMTKKAKKTDVASVKYLIADLDPYTGESPEAAKARYLKAFETFNPPATALIDSGNGIQGLWKLENPIPLGEPVWVTVTKKKKGKEVKVKELQFTEEDQAIIADAEGRSKAMMAALGCDDTSTFNIDRILRVPGTTNLPNKKKKEEGRVPCQAVLLHFVGAAYPLDVFPEPAPAPKPKPKPKRTSQRQGLPQNLIAMLHVEGAGPYPSRSEALFAFINAAVRRGVADDDIIDALLSHGDRRRN